MAIGGDTMSSDKLSLDEILIPIKQKLNERHITHAKVEVVLSWYRHAKDKVDFELIESSHLKIPLIKEIGKINFYIYDDFYSSTKYIYYDSIAIKKSASSYRVCFRVVKGDEKNGKKGIN